MTKYTFLLLTRVLYFFTFNKLLLNLLKLLVTIEKRNIRKKRTLIYVDN